MNSRNRWPDLLNLAFGAWLFVSPWVLGTSDDGASSWTAWIVGALVVAVSLVALAAPALAVDEGVGLALGVLLLVAPWLFGYADVDSANANAWIVGPLVALVSFWGVTAARQFGARAHGAHA